MLDVDENQLSLSLDLLHSPKYRSYILQPMYRRTAGDKGNGRLRKTEEQIAEGRTKARRKAVREVLCYGSTLLLTVSFVQLKHRDISEPILGGDSSPQGNHFNPFRVFARDRPVDTANHHSPLSSISRANTGSTTRSIDRPVIRKEVSLTEISKRLSRRG